jgi:hypothetical protein
MLSFVALRQASLWRERPIRRLCFEGYRCYVEDRIVDVEDFFWDDDRFLFTDGSALHGLYRGIGVATIEADEIGKERIRRYLKMRVPEGMRHLSSIAEYLGC